MSLSAVLEYELEAETFFSWWNNERVGKQTPDDGSK